MLNRLVFFCLFLVSLQLQGQFYSGSHQTFGRNRIQYTKDRDWHYYRFNEFDTYYYKGGQSLAIYTSAYADKQIRMLSKKMATPLESKIQFLVFKDLSDLLETNVGLITNTEYNTGGLTHVMENKVFLYFTGDHASYEQQINRGIAQVMVNEIMYGGSAGSKMKNSMLLNFPTWYTQGLVNYLGQNWDTDLDHQLREIFRLSKYDKFDRLSAEQQIVVGHSLWRYIEIKYGSKMITDVLYMAKINRNLENGFLYVLGLNFETLIMEWKSFYAQAYDPDFKLSSNPEHNIGFKLRKGKHYDHIKLSTDGRYVAYTTNEMGKVRVRVYDREKKRHKTIYKSGYKIDDKVDFSYPLITWSPMGNFLAVIYEKKKDNFLTIFNLDDKEKRTKFLGDFDRVHDFTYNPRGNTLAISGIKSGQSDIYLLSIASNSMQRITQDAFDDFYPSFTQDGNSIFWSSNRWDDTLRKIDLLVSRIAEDTIRGMNKFDLFQYSMVKGGSTARRITNTPLANETHPLSLDKNFYSWLSDENGIINRYVGSFDSAISYIDTSTHYRYYTKYAAVTNYISNIQSYDVNPELGLTADLFTSEGRQKIHLQTLESLEQLERQKLHYTQFMSLMVTRFEEERKLKEFRLQAQQNRLINLANDTVKLPNLPAELAIIANETELVSKKFRVVTQSELDPESANHKLENIQNPTENLLPDNASKQALQSAKTRGPADEILAAYVNRPYKVQFSIDEVVSQVDFSYFNYGYQAFTNPQYPIYINNGFNAMFKLGVLDLFEDYRLIGGVRLSPNLKNNEYFLSYFNLKNRLDHEFTFHRNSVTDQYGYLYWTTYTHDLFYRLGIPLNRIKGFKLTLGLRSDNIVLHSVETQTLAEPNQFVNNGIAKLEYIYDKSRSGGLNITYGTRYKLFGEYYQPIEDLGNNTVVLGFDFRRYFKIHKTIVWANRLAGSTSFGTQPLVYYLGGVDDWIGAKFSPNIQVDPEIDYKYQTLATNMRGFPQNIRNGNNFFVFNSELRIPPFQYFSRRPIESSFWNNFMVVTFFDAGSAWTGMNPYSESNSLFRKTIYQYPIKVTIISQEDPLVAGFGFGLRAQVFGYYMRADWAWGMINGYITDKPMFYYSLSLDF